MRPVGVIQPLIRERRPFAALAMAALLVPVLLTAAGLSAAIGASRLADGTVVICTSDGFIRVTDPASYPDRHDTCCLNGCVHAGSPGLAGQAIASAGLPTQAAQRMNAACDNRDASVSPALPGAIRAPPSPLA